MSFVPAAFGVGHSQLGEHRIEGSAIECERQKVNKAPARSSSVESNLLESGLTENTGKVRHRAGAVKHLTVQ